MSDTRLQVRLADRCSDLSTACSHCPLVVCLSCVTADFLLCHSRLVAVPVVLTHPSHLSLVVTRPFTGARDVHLLGSWCCSVRSAVYLCCGGTRRLLCGASLVFLETVFFLLETVCLLVGDRLRCGWRRRTFSPSSKTRDIADKGAGTASPLRGGGFKRAQQGGVGFR